MLNKTSGIIVGTKRIGEADAIITLLSEEKEKSRFLINGIKKSKSRPIVASEVGSVVIIDYYEKKDARENHVKEISVTERFDKLKSSYFGFLVLNYFCELSNHLIQDGEKHEKAYKLLSAAFTELDENDFNYLILPYFKLRLLNFLGLIGSEFHCHTCEEGISQKKACEFDPTKFEVSCSDCHQISENHIEVLRLMEFLFKKNYANLKTLVIPDVLLSKVDFFLNSFLNYFLRVELKSQKLIYEEIGHVRTN